MNIIEFWSCILGDIYFHGFEFEFGSGQKGHWVVCASQNYPLCMRFAYFYTEPYREGLRIATSRGSVIGNYSGSFAPPKLNVYINTLLSFTSGGPGSFSFGEGFAAEFCKQFCTHNSAFCHMLTVAIIQVLPPAQC